MLCKAEHRAAQAIVSSLLLPPGIYTLIVTSPRFKEFRREELVVESNRALSVPVSLVLGSASEMVEVVAGKFLDEWRQQTMRSRIEPMKKIARSLRQHRELILNYFRAQKLSSSGTVED